MSVDAYFSFCLCQCVYHYISFSRFVRQSFYPHAYATRMLGYMRLSSNSRSILLLLLPSSSDRSAINQRSFHCPTEIGATVRSSHPCLYNNPAISMHAGVPCPVRVISVALYHYQYWFPGLAWIITWSCQGASIRAFIIWILYSCCIACTYVLNIDRVPI